MDGFRACAQQCLRAAQDEMNSNDATRLPYAALRLRMALEALVYERAHAYRHHIDLSDSDTWQPAKVMDALLSADPNANKGITLAMGLEETYGVPPPKEEMTIFGTEHVVSTVMIKKHYNALGYFLHLPTIKQLNERGDPKPDAIRRHCEAVASDVDKALSSPISGMVVYGVVDFQCRRCGGQIERATPLVPHRFVTTCPACNAVYRLDTTAGDTTVITPAFATIRCRQEPCLGEHALWPDEAKPGATWTCQVCGEAHKLILVPWLVSRDAGNLDKTPDLGSTGGRSHVAE